MGVHLGQTVGQKRCHREGVRGGSTVDGWRRLNMNRFWKATLVFCLLLVCVAAGGTLWLQQQIQTQSYCANCHVMARYYSSWKSSVFPAHTHAQNGLVCQDCHEVTLRSAVWDIFSNVTHSYQLPLKEQKVQAEACFRCHASYAQLAEMTNNLKGPDGFALGRNPHNSHWGQLECGTCHKMHRVSRDWCSECHGLKRTGPAWNAPAAAVHPAARKEMNAALPAAAKTTNLEGE